MRSLRICKPTFEKHRNNQKFITKERIEAFAKGLKPHHRAILASGRSNIDEVFLEHNIIVTSHFYRDIKIDAFAKRMNLTRYELEQILQKMNSSSKISLSIDHRNKLIVFQSGKDILRVESDIVQENMKQLTDFFSLLEQI